jgi:hypothetical protein
MWPLSGGYSIIVVKSAHPGEDGGGGSRLPPSALSTNTSKVVYAPAERADTLPLFLLYPCMYSVDAQCGNFSCFVLRRFVSMYPHFYEN